MLSLAVASADVTPTKTSPMPRPARITQGQNNAAARVKGSVMA
jgi:hypothetical protein